MAGKKKKRLSSAIKVDHSKAMLPPPTPALLLELAVGLHLSVAGAASHDDPETNLDWTKLDEGVREYWIAGARCAYSIIAVHGGADLVQL